jgi:hypothetical protein
MKKFNWVLKLSKIDREYPLFKNDNHFYWYKDRGKNNRCWNLYIKNKFNSRLIYLNELK